MLSSVALEEDESSVDTQSLEVLVPEHNKDTRRQYIDHCKAWLEVHI